MNKHIPEGTSIETNGTCPLQAFIIFITGTKLSRTGGLKLNPNRASTIISYPVTATNESKNMMATD